MAGEIIPLCHLAQTFVGEGFVLGPGGERIACRRLVSRARHPALRAEEQGGPLAHQRRRAGAGARLRSRPPPAAHAGFRHAHGGRFDRGTRPHRSKLIRTMSGALRREFGLEDIAVPLHRLLDGSAGRRATRASRPSRSASFRRCTASASTPSVPLKKRSSRSGSRSATIPAFIADDTSPALRPAGPQRQFPLRRAHRRGGSGGAGDGPGRAALGAAAAPPARRALFEAEPAARSPARASMPASSSCTRRRSG